MDTSQTTRPWSEIGFGGIKKEEERYVNSISMPNRFWMRTEEERQIVFVDDDPFMIHEHNPKINGDFRNWLTCVKGIEDDPTCCNLLGEKTRYYVGFLTIIDCTETFDRKGTKYQYEMKLFPMKLKTLKKFERQRKNRGSLIGCMYKVTRLDQKSPNCGDEFEFEREVQDMNKLLQLANFRGKKIPDLYAKAKQNPGGLESLRQTFQIELDDTGALIEKLVPFSYVSLLKPKSSKELKTMLSNVNIENAQTPKEEPVPF